MLVLKPIILRSTPAQFSSVAESQYVPLSKQHIPVAASLHGICSPCRGVIPGKTSNDFKYLTTHAPAEDQDFTGLAEVQDAIRELGINIDDEKDVFKALGGLLHLGQVRRFCS